MNMLISRCFYRVNLVVIFTSLWCSTVLAKQKDIQLAVLMPAPAKIIHQNWQPLANYLSTKLGRPVKIVTPRGLEESKKAISSVDFVYANSYLFSLLKQEANLTAVAQMKNTGNSIYSRGRWLVRKDSSIQAAKDLKGKKIALISPNGAGSYLAPRAYLAKHGMDVGKDVKLEFTGNLKKAAYMVMLGDADSAVMCDVNYKILSSKIDTGDLRFIDVTEPFPEAVLFTPHESNSDVVKQFQKVLLEETPERETAFTKLHGMKIGTFIPYDKGVEVRIKELRQEAGIE